jgi:hypothetical protein
MSTLAEQMEQDRKLLDTAEEIMEQDRKLLDTAEEIVEKITPLSKSPSEISAEAMLIRVDIETILISPNGKAGVLDATQREELQLLRQEAARVLAL